MKKIPAEVRFHAKYIPELNTGCWLWTGAIRGKGYGVIRLGSKKEGSMQAHRFSYLIHKGAIPDNMSGEKTFISFEPLIGDMGDAILKLNVSGIIIGAMTGAGSVKPEKAWVEKLIENAGGKPVFLKNNLLSLFPELPRRQETAWVL